jgi:hypothetical protein
MTINLAETYNFVLIKTRDFPLTTIVEDTFHVIVKYISERRPRTEMHMMNNRKTHYCERFFFRSCHVSIHMSSDYNTETT